MRATVTWWVIFCGPVVIAVAVGVAGLVSSGGVGAVWTFTIGVWALAMTIGLAAMPDSRDMTWLLKTFAGSFAAAGLALGLLFGVSTVGEAVQQDLAPTPTTSTTSASAPARSSTTSVPTTVP